MTPRFTLSQRIRYRLDNSLARGISGLLAWMGLVALLFILAIAVILWLTGWYTDEGTPAFIAGIWFALTRSLDAGTFTGDAGGQLRVIGIMVTLVGIFLVAAIIGLVSSAIDRWLESLRRGRSLVVETGHSIIIGSNDKLPAVIREIVEANASNRDHAIVLLSSGDPVELADQVRSWVGDMQTTRLIVRSGSPTRLADVSLINPAQAKSVIVLRPEAGSDAEVVKTVLALNRAIPSIAQTPIVAELTDGNVGDALRAAVGDRVLTVMSPDVIARIGAQVARSPGLGVVYQELLDFEGDELYSTPVTSVWVGRSYGEALLSSSTGTVVGVRFSDGRTLLNPEPETVLAQGDALIAIAQDDSVYALDRVPEGWQRAGERAQPAERRQERTLIIGWSDLGPRIAREIDGHVAEGSSIHVLAGHDDGQTRSEIDSLGLIRATVSLEFGDPILLTDIAASLRHGPFEHVLLLSERDAFEPEEADARTMLALLQLRRCIAGAEVSPSVVAELLDPHATELIGDDERHDFIVSQRLIGLLLAQLSESPHLAPVLDDLFGAVGTVGAAVEMHPVTRYLPPGDHSFADVIRACREFGVTAIGYRSTGAVGVPGALAGGIRLNPPKEESLRLGADDVVVVLTGEPGRLNGG